MGIVALVAGAIAVALATLFYVRGEPPVRGRGVLAALRVMAIVVVVALLLDLRLPDPQSPESADASGAWVLLDAELSLTATGPEAAGTLWDEALARAADASAAGAGIAITTPGGVERVEVTDLSGRAPQHPSGDVIDAVVRLAEAGADSVTVLTSLRWPAGGVEALATRSPVPVRIERLGDAVPNVGVLSLDLDEALEADEPTTAVVELFAEAAGGDSVTIEIRAEGLLAATTSVPAPGVGARRTIPIDLPPPPDTGLVRYTARAFLDGDAFADDDLRARWAEVGRERRGIVVVSLEPDWEPRTLLPVLEAVTGLQGTGYLELEDGSFLPLVSGSEGSDPVDSDAVVRAVEASELLVVHGVGPVAPDWLATVVGAHPRSLHFPLGLAGERLGGMPEGIRTGGEWLTVPEPPPSPLSAFFAGIGLGGLPPLSDLRVGPAPGIVVLEAALSGREPEPALVLVERPAGRRAVSRAQGFWRWASRGGEPRRAYRALWGGVAEWLLSGETGFGDVRPDGIPQRRGEPLRWIFPTSAEGASLALQRLGDGLDGPVETLIADAEGAAEPPDTVPFSPGEPGRAATPPVAPGVYRYSVIRADGTDTAPATGLVEVERWVPSLSVAPLEAPEDRIAGLADVTGAERRRGRPLRTHPIPYLLLLALLSAEWLGRRRAGLR